MRVRGWHCKCNGTQGLKAVSCCPRAYCICACPAAFAWPSCLRATHPRCSFQHPHLTTIQPKHCHDHVACILYTSGEIVDLPRYLARPKVVEPCQIG